METNRKQRYENQGIKWFLVLQKRDIPRNFLISLDNNPLSYFQSRYTQLKGFGSVSLMRKVSKGRREPIHLIFLLDQESKRLTSIVLKENCLELISKIINLFRITTWYHIMAPKYA